MQKECDVCHGEGSYENVGSCGHPECCGDYFINCWQCDGEGIINEEEETA